MMHYDSITSMEQMIPAAMVTRLQELGLSDHDIRLFAGYITINSKYNNIYLVERTMLGRGYDRDSDNYLCWAASQFKLNVEELNPYYDQYR